MRLNHRSSLPLSFSLLGHPPLKRKEGCLFYQSSPEPEVSRCYLTLNLYNGQLLSTAIKLKQLQLPVCVWTNRQANPTGYIKYCNHIPPPLITLSYFILFCNRLQCGFLITNCPWKTSSKIWMRRER